MVCDFPAETHGLISGLEKWFENVPYDAWLDNLLDYENHTWLNAARHLADSRQGYDYFSLSSVTLWSGSNPPILQGLLCQFSINAAATQSNGDCWPAYRMNESVNSTKAFFSTEVLRHLYSSLWYPRRDIDARPVLIHEINISE
jgi:hypothetical protein